MTVEGMRSGRLTDGVWFVMALSTKNKAGLPCQVPDHTKLACYIPKGIEPI